MRFILFIIFSSFILWSDAQSSLDLTVRMTGLNYDTLWFGNTFGKRAVPKTFTTKKTDGSYQFIINDPLPEGQYAIIFKRAVNAKYTFISILVPDKERKMEVKMDINDVFQSAQFIGSPENTYFFRYLNSLYDLLDKRDSTITEWRMLQDEDHLSQLMAAEKEISQLQQSVIQSDPSSLSARLVNSLLFPTPEATGKNIREKADNRQKWIMSHFFDRVSPTDSAMWRMPLFIEWLDLYTFKSSQPYPDSAILFVNDILKRLENDADKKEYYFNYMVNSFSKMSRFNMDEVFIHLFRNYIEKGKAPWTSAEEQKNMLKDIERIEKVLVGKPAPDITLYDRENQPVRIYDVKAPYTLLVFWNPDCSHCQKELPIVARIHEHFKPKGLKVIATCGKKGDQLATCWQYIDDKKLPADWLYLGDINMQSRFSSLYDLRAYPKLYLLDEHKKILFRRGGESSEAELMLFFEKIMGK